MISSSRRKPGPHFRDAQIKMDPGFRRDDEKREFKSSALLLGSMITWGKTFANTARNFP